MLGIEYVLIDCLCHTVLGIIIDTSVSHCQ